MTGPEIQALYNEGKRDFAGPPCGVHRQDAGAFESPHEVGEDFRWLLPAE